jgi:hypothetical protein
MLFINSVSLAARRILVAIMLRCQDVTALWEFSADEFNMTDGPYYIQKVIKTIKIEPRGELTAELAYVLFTLEGTLPKEAIQVGLSKGMTSFPARVM